MNKLIEQLEELSTKVSQQLVTSPDISKSNVGWHIEHTLLVTNKIIEEIKNSNPQNYKWRFNMLRIVIYITKKIPRGRGEAPEIFIPKSFNKETLTEHLKVTKSNIKKLDSLNSNNYFNHPYFGFIKLKKTIQFIEIHTNHHTEIINDIINSKT